MALPQTLPISRLINVSVSLAAQAAQGQNLNALLILGTSTVIDVTTRIRSYTTIAQVATDFGTTAPEYLAAVLWFEQNPQPTQLYIGRWANAASSGQLFGGPLTVAQQVIALWTAVTAGGFLIYVDGVPQAVTGLNFSAAANLNAVAASIQTVLAGLSSGSTVVWNSTFNRFEFKSGTTGTASSVSFVSPSTAVGNFAFTGNPSGSDSITLNGTTVTFVTGTPSGNQVKILGSQALTIASLLSFLQASADAQIVKFTYSVVGSTLYVVAATPGTGGNALTIAKSSAVISVSGATLSGAVAGDISAMLIATNTVGNGAYTSNGIASETAVAAVTLFDTKFGQQWFAVTVPAAVDSDHSAIAAYIEGAANYHFYGVTTQEAAVLTPGDTTSIPYVLQQAAYNRTAVQYSSSNQYAVVSLLARILTTNYSGNNTVITLMYKQEPGITAENLNSTQIAALEAKNCNVFVAYNNNTAIIETGICPSGQFIDTVIGSLALAVQIQTAVYNVLFTSTTKIPQTDAGTHLMTTAIAQICAHYVQNGWLAPGVWTGAGFGQLNTNDFMPSGFYIFAPSVTTQTAAVRATRVSVPIQVAAKLAGAIHDVSVSIVVNS